MLTLGQSADSRLLGVQAGVRAALQERLQGLLAAGPVSAGSVAWLQAASHLAAATRPPGSPSGPLLEAWQQHRAPLLSNALRWAALQ